MPSAGQGKKTAGQRFNSHNHVGIDRKKQMTSSVKQLKEVIVLGAGVIGLTTAIKIQERGGYHVHVISEVLPSDPKSIKYTSHWAGAHHVSLAGDDVKQQKIDRETFDIMWKLSAPGCAAEGSFLRIQQEEYYGEEKAQPDPLEFMPDFKVLPQDSLVHPKAVHGISFRTITIDVPAYLNYLLSRLLTAGASVTRGTVQHIDQLVEGGAYPFTGTGAGPTPPDAIIVCAGLGARTLGGVEDKEVFSMRGQTVLLRAPWVRFGRTISTKEGLWTYTIPRRRGDVIVGGTKAINDWYPHPRPETTRDILRRALELVPELAPPGSRSEHEPTVDDLLPLVVEEGCGLRPARNGGIRLEMEWAKAARDSGRIPVVHNYGHGGYGYISSWGSASVALKLLEGALAE